MPTSGSGAAIGAPVWRAALAATALIGLGENPVPILGHEAFLADVSAYQASTSGAIVGQQSSWFPVQTTPATQDELDAQFALTDDLSEQSKAALGAHAYGRLQKFLSYTSGWAGGEGQTPAPISLALLDNFLSLSPEFATEPSIFLTREGFFELVWETQLGNRIELTFGADGIAYFLGDDSNEGILPLASSKLEELLQLAKQV